MRVAPIEGKFPSVEVLFKNAWSKTAGAKKTLLSSAVVAFLALWALAAFKVIFFGQDSGVFELPFSLLQLGLSGVLTAGLMEMGVRRAKGEDLSISQLLAFKDRWFTITLVILVQTIFTVIGFICLLLPGIYLVVSYMFAGLVAGKQEKGVWESLETSRKAVTKRWFTIFVCLVLMSIIVSVSMIPLGIGLIWSLPFSQILAGEIYLALFEQETI